jgi:hypothetical protein
MCCQPCQMMRAMLNPHIRLPRCLGLDYSVESLRRTKALHILKGTGDLQTVRALLGHARIESTARYLGLKTKGRPHRGLSGLRYLTLLVPTASRPIGGSSRPRTSRLSAPLPRFWSAAIFIPRLLICCCRRCLRRIAARKFSNTAANFPVEQIQSILLPKPPSIFTKTARRSCSGICLYG